MERFSTLGLVSAPTLPEVELRLDPGVTPSNVIPFSVATDEPLRFPAEDGGQSLAEHAERDLDAALQLLAERARYITGASGVAIALRDGDGMTCRASTGTSAPPLGSYLEMNSGLSAESARLRQILCCEDAATDSRVNRESCVALGIASALVMPLLRDGQVLGIFELFSGEPGRFGERDFAALERLGEMILTAIGHAEAAHRAQEAMAQPVYQSAESAAFEVEPEVVSESLLSQIESLVLPDVPSTAVEAPLPGTLPEPRSQVRQCAACGFPVSDQRTYCLDCEAGQPSNGSYSGDAGAAPAFLSDLTEPAASRANSRFYLIGSLLLTLLTLAAFLWLR
jgi:hypothetical protein